MSRVESNCQKFVRRAVVPSAGYTRLCLLQVMTQGGSNTLRDVPLSSDFGYDESKITELVADLLATAQEDADNHRGLTTYCLKAFKGITQGERSPLFRLRAQESDVDDGEALGETEAATKDGHLAQLMRHNESYARTLTQVFEVQARASTERERGLQEQLRHYQDAHWETILRAEELASEKDEREAAKILIGAQEKRKDQALALIKPIVPILMSKFKGTPESAKPGLIMESLKAILADITPEKMEKLAEILGPHSLALATIYMDAHKDDEEKTNEPTTDEKGAH